MSKMAPILIILIILSMLIISWKNVLSYNDNLKAEYNEHITAAEMYYEKEIYVDAAKEYEAALAIQPDNYDVSVIVIDLYSKLGDKKKYVEACQKAIEADSTQETPYLLISDYYIEDGDYKKAYNYLKQAEGKIPQSDDIIERMKLIKSQYTLVSLEYDTFSGWLYSSENKYGYARVSIDGKYGLLKSNNKPFIKCEYEDIGPLANEVIPVCKENEYYYITKEGYRKIVTDKDAEYLGAFTSNYAPAKIDGMYGYIDKKANEYHFEYDYAGCFANGIAAVQKGNKWGIINSSFKEINKFEFDEVLIDEYGICSAYGVFWAKQDGKYYLYDKNGKKLSEGFDSVKLFASSEAAAVKIGGKWGFINKTGEMIIDGIYDDAKSFNVGYAPFLKDNKWGCIDEKGNVLIEPTFESMEAFSDNGYALITDEGIRKFLIINLYE